MNSHKTKHVIIVGGGIAGLSAAYYLQAQTETPLKITLLERANYWGGKIITERIDDFVIEGGPDTFIVTKPWAVQLCKELGISERLRGTNPNTKNTYILHKDQLMPIPGGLTMMIPTEFGPMLRSRLLSWPAKMRMGIDFFIPPAKQNNDESLGTFVTRRLGREAYEHLIEPLMSGIYAGDGDQLSLAATLPYLRDLEEKHGGLVKGALAVRRKRGKSSNGKAAPGSRSIFLTPLTGLAEIVEALVDNLQKAAVDLRLSTAVQSVVHFDSGFCVDLTSGEQLLADAVILATPAYVSANLVASIDKDLAAGLATIDYVSTATVTFAYPESQLPRALDGYGYVIPRSAGRSALACTWTSTKFPHRAPDGYALIRVFIGRAGQEDEIPWDDVSLEKIAKEELALTLGITAKPSVTRIFRWEKAMPQYNIGHLARLERLDNILEKYSGLALAGNGYRGIGIPDCIHSGQLAVENILDTLKDKSAVEKQQTLCGPSRPLAVSRFSLRAVWDLIFMMSMTTVILIMCFPGVRWF
jgi:oxygen-dependent protoporphyrinogen oxidase